MICKKCGREYEDDMPKCLWCDAPNESLSSQDECETSAADSEAQEEAYRESLKKLVDPELERAFDDNVRRGKSAISWTKFQIVINVIFFFVEVKTFGAFQNYQVGTTVSEEFKSALGPYSFSFCSPPSPISFSSAKTGSGYIMRKKLRANSQSHFSLRGKQHFATSSLSSITSSLKTYLKLNMTH